MELPLEMIIPAQKVYLEHTIAPRDTHSKYVPYHNQPDFPTHPMLMRVTVEDIDDEYHSWHKAQDWLLASDPALPSDPLSHTEIFRSLFTP